MVRGSSLTLSSTKNSFILYMNLALGALQDLVEDKEEHIEHEKMVDDDETYKTAEDFENSIFKDDTYRKGKDKQKQKEKEKENNDMVDGT